MGLGACLVEYLTGRQLLTRDARTSPIAALLPWLTHTPVDQRSDGARMTKMIRAGKLHDCVDVPRVLIQAPTVSLHIVGLLKRMLAVHPTDRLSIREIIGVVTHPRLTITITSPSASPVHPTSLRGHCRPIGSNL